MFLGGKSTRDLQRGGKKKSLAARLAERWTWAKEELSDWSSPKHRNCK